MYRKAILGLFTLTAVLVSTVVFAQTGDDAVIYQAFGRGVHYYNAQNYSAAFDELTKCVDNSSKNPSVYYFRGLALMNLGREDDAVIDFKKGAELEGVSISSVQKQIGYDLQFVQGEVRQKLEGYRASAKLAAYQKAREIAALQENIDAKNVDTSVGYWGNDGYIYNGQTGTYEEYDTPETVTSEDDGDMIDGEEDGEESEDGEEMIDDFDDEEDETEEDPETISIEDEIDSEESSDDEATDVNIDDEIGDVDFGGDDTDDVSAFGDDDDDDADADADLAGDDDDADADADADLVGDDADDDADADADADLAGDADDDDADADADADLAGDDDDADADADADLVGDDDDADADADADLAGDDDDDTTVEAPEEAEEDLFDE